MNKNNQSMRSKNIFGRLTQGILLACLMLGFGFAELQAQTGVGASYYNSVGDEITNEISLEPGDYFTLQLGLTIDPGVVVAGLTATMFYDNELLIAQPDAAGLPKVTDGGSPFIFPITNEVHEDEGWFTYSKFILGSTVGEGSYTYLTLEFQVNPDLVYATSTEIFHELGEGVNNKSNISYAGMGLMEFAPALNINIIGEEPFECPDLGLNIGDDCDANGVAGTVDDDCNCVANIVTPANDLPCDAIALECGADIAGSTENATTEGTPTDLCGTITGTYGGVWYSFIGEGNLVTVSLCGSDYDTKLNVYSGACDALECVGGNDDNFDACGSGNNSQLEPFTAIEGVEYFVYVNGYSTNFGAFNLNISCVEFECPELLGNIGDACDDGNPDSNSDVITADCECVGSLEPVECLNTSSYGSVVLNNEVGVQTISTCNFEEEYSTVSNVVEGNTYEFATNSESFITVRTGSFDGPILASGYSPVSVVAPDGENLYPHWNNDDECGTASACVVTTVQCTSCTADCNIDGVDYYYGDACDDLDDTTYDDVIGDDCNCAGTPYDCIDLMANIGDACDDNDPLTNNDVIVEGCGCAGTSVIVDIDCAQPYTATYCYTPNDDSFWLYTGEEGSTLNLNFASGIIEGSTYDNITIYDGDSDAAPVLYTSVGEGYGVDLTGVDVNSTGNSIYVSMYSDGSVSCSTGSTSATEWTYTVSCNEVLVDCPGLGNYGDPCDDGNADTENDMVNDNCECMGTPIVVWDCPNLEANIGDACDDGDADTENDMVNDNCGCEGTPIVPSDCEEWVMYMNNNAGGVTDIYGVDISSGDAELTYITTVDYQAHIAYNPANNLIYVIHNGNASYVTVNPHSAVPEISAPVFLSMDVASVTTAAFHPNGKLMIGTMTEDKIYSVDVAVPAQTVALYDGYAPISGGDIEFAENGALYLATRAGNGYYQVYPDDVMADQLLANIPSLVTGMARTESGQMIMSHKYNADLQLRNVNGTDAMMSYPLMLDGEPYAHDDGDMTSGCNTYSDDNQGDCDAFSTFYMNHAPGSNLGSLYSVAFSGSNANLTLLTTVDFSAHIAYNAMDDIVYIVNPNGSFIRAYDPTTDSFLGDLAIDGDINDIVAVVYNPADGLLYVGSSSTTEIYTIDLVSGAVNSFADAPVQGGDLAIQGGKLYLATRNGDKLYEMVGGVAVEVGGIATSVNGMAQANNADDVVIANLNSNVFTQVNASDASVVNTYAIMLDGDAFTALNGDMAAGCGDDDPSEETGECNATEVIEYVVGTTLGGGAVAANRTDGSQALGAPERTDEMVFATLGYGGSITVAFDGSVPNGAGDDIEVVETSFNNPGCASYPEYADVSVSMDGSMWYSVGTVCKGEPFVDISDASVELDYVMFVRVTNINDQTSTSDGFDVDGIVAIHNCVEGPGVTDNNSVVEANGLSTISSYPNPTNGPSQVVFVTAETGRALVEVYDMNGRNVSTLYNQVAQAGMEYRVDFNGSSLPNGVYVYKLTTDNETIINKFMIAR
jgi:hypothetical protein